MCAGCAVGPVPSPGPGAPAPGCADRAPTADDGDELAADDGDELATDDGDELAPDRLSMCNGGRR